ncbi:MAG: helix-turn-helix transcriptional regulator [Agriterribacter sp.]
MKSALQKSSIPSSRIFVAKDLSEKHFDPTWHAHGEYQLFLVTKGSGTRFIGNTVKSFAEGDITFIAPGVPHLWRSDRAYFDKKSKLVAEGLVIYFKGDFVADMLDKEEMRSINVLFTKAKRAIEFYGQAVTQLAGMMKKIVEARGVESIIQLFQILHMMCSTKEYKLLHHTDYSYKLKESETHRINLVYNYAAQHFHSAIALQEVADLLSMTPTSFSRYFRLKTGKSFSDFVTELRISHACKLLVEDDRKTVQQVGYDCGFNTLSNFNKQFKIFMRTTPKSYRAAFSSL